MHRLRVLSALLLLLPFFLIVQFGSSLQFNLMVSLAILLCAWEFAWLCPLGADLGMAISTAVGSLVWQWSLIWGFAPGAVAPLVAVGMLTRALATPEELRTGVLRAAWTLLGVAYVGGLMGAASLLRDGPDGRQLAYLAALTTWAGDTGAYYVGRRLGRRPLAPRISPKKTIEGALGGLAATVLIAALGSRLDLAEAVRDDGAVGRRWSGRGWHVGRPRRSRRSSAPRGSRTAGRSFPATGACWTGWIA